MQKTKSRINAIFRPISYFRPPSKIRHQSATLLVTYANIVTMTMRNKQLTRDLQNQILPMLIGLEEEGGEEEEEEEKESYCNRGFGKPLKNGIKKVDFS